MATHHWSWYSGYSRSLNHHPVVNIYQNKTQHQQYQRQRRLYMIGPKNSWYDVNQQNNQSNCHSKMIATRSNVTYYCWRDYFDLHWLNHRWCTPYLQFISYFKVKYFGRELYRMYGRSIMYPSSKIIYGNMQHFYAYIQVIYIYMKPNYVAYQHNYVACWHT